MAVFFPNENVTPAPMFFSKVTVMFLPRTLYVLEYAMLARYTPADIPVQLRLADVL